MSTPTRAIDSGNRRRKRLSSAVLNFLRGGVIGSVEVVPGISGGTLALVVGVYETIITSAGELVRGTVTAASALARRTGMGRAREHFARVRWDVLIPLGIGMLAAIIAVSATVAPLIERHPIQSRALFAGLVAASLIVPARMVGRWRPIHVALAIPAAAAAFALAGLTGVERVNPSLWFVALAASFAVCALVLPGVSGAFLLVLLGMYAPTLAAVNDRNFVFLAAFIGGAIVGLSLFVTALQWLLAHRRAVTLAVMTGLMFGSLRALWPWQTESAELQAPSGSLAPIIGLFFVGVAAVAALLLMEHLGARRVEREREAAEQLLES